jgi:hypothetical protein
VAERYQLARPLMRCGACFHADQARWQFAEVVERLSSPQPHLRERAARVVGCVDLKNLFGDVESKRLSATLLMLA